MQGRMLLLRKGFLFTTILSFIFIVILSSCKEEFTELGKSVIPDDEYLGFKRDTLIAVNAYTIQSPVYPTNKQDKNVFLGIINDPVIGKTKYSFMTEIQEPTDIFYKDLTSLDSAILKLVIRDRYGYNNVQQNYSVYRLSKTIESPDSIIYYNNEDPSPYYTEGSIISERTSRIGDTLFIKLKSNFVQALLDDVKDEEDLISGIYCKVDDHDLPIGSVFTIDLLSDTTSFINLHYQDSTELEQQIVKFPINTSGNHIEFTKHIREGYPINQYLLNDTTETDSLIFIQGMNGTDVKLRFKPLSEWIEKGPYAINDVKLIVKLDDNTANRFDAYDIPENLAIKEGKSIEYLSDITGYEGFDYAEYDKDNKRYVFKITEPFIKHITNADYEEYSLFIRLPNYASDPSRVVLQGGELEVFVTYTKLE